MSDSHPEVVFLPLALPSGDGFRDRDPGVLARRIPDFVHQILNQGRLQPTGMLEIQSPPEEGPVGWVLFDSPPEPDELLELMPDDARVRAAVTGQITGSSEGLRVEFHVHLLDELQEGLTSKVGGTLPWHDPVSGLMRVTRRLARLLEVPYSEPERGLLTRNGMAFFRFLDGLDNAMLLSGDLAIEMPEDREQLMEPFAEALKIDSTFGLALRVAHTTLAIALEGSHLEAAACYRFLDRCFSALPDDGEGCVAVAEHLAVMGEDKRAIAWLKHATHLEPPPPRGLENLGIMFANRGETVEARSLWLRGLDIDGHPDFCAHLARLYFAEGQELDAWDMVLRGLRRIQERAARRGEWNEEDRGAGVLLQYLVEHMSDKSAPEDLVEALVDLRNLLTAEDRIDLGICLMGVGRRMEARQELAEGLKEDLDESVRDLGVRAILNLDVHDFERRFARAAEGVTKGRSVRAALSEFQLFLRLQPEFWPAMFFSAVGQRHLGFRDEPLDLLAEVLRLRPAQPDALQHMARLFDERGNSKRAVECIELALRERGEDTGLIAARCLYLVNLGRGEQAREYVRDALERHPGDRQLLRARRQIGA